MIEKILSLNRNDKHTKAQSFSIIDFATNLPGYLPFYLNSVVKLTMSIEGKNKVCYKNYNYSFQVFWQLIQKARKQDVSKATACCRRRLTNALRAAVMAIVVVMQHYFRHQQLRCHLHRCRHCKPPFSTASFFSLSRTSPSASPIPIFLLLPVSRRNFVCYVARYTNEPTC